MSKSCILIFFVFFTSLVQSQSISQNTLGHQQDSIKKSAFLKQLGNGYFPTKYFNFDLRYLIKFNQYEGVRTGLGGITNKGFSETFRLNGYLVYGFRDHTFKYNIGGGFRIAKKTDTWLNLNYTDDLQETGSSEFLTDSRFFQFFEPRLLNIDLFQHQITKTISLDHKMSKNLFSNTEFAVNNINPTYNYGYILNNKTYHEFHLSTLKMSLQWNPFSDYGSIDKGGLIESKEGFTKFTLQYTQNLKKIFGSDFNFSKIDFRAQYQIHHNNAATTLFELRSGIAIGKAPLTSLYHSYPNNINKLTILNRFSVAGINSFETMYFNEFFSDRFTTFQLKHFLKPFDISKRSKPQLVLISRFGIGNMSHLERHQYISFKTLDKGYTESGFEINKLLFGFGLSFSYRYGAYYLPKFEDNIAFKFTFNVTL